MTNFSIFEIIAFLLWCLGDYNSQMLLTMTMTAEGIRGEKKVVRVRLTVRLLLMLQLVTVNSNLTVTPNRKPYPYGVSNFPRHYQSWDVY
jgi:hypothetical protein